MTVYGGTEGNANYPFDYTVSTWDGTGWVQQASVVGATSAVQKFTFEKPVTTTAVRIHVTKANGGSGGAANECTRIREVIPGFVPVTPPQADQPAPQLRTTFDVTEPVESARLYMATGGYHEPWVNGTKVSGDRVLEPGFTVYNKRVQYTTYDVTDDLVPGDNVLAAALGRGFFGETTVTDWAWDKSPWHGEPRTKAVLRIEYEDGDVEEVLTDDSWKQHASPTTHDSIYLGEVYDARKETPGWTRTGFDDNDWTAATVYPAPTDKLVAQNQTPIRTHAPVPASPTEVSR